MRIRIKRIGNHDLPVPERKSEGAAGYDLHACFSLGNLELAPGETLDIPTGFAFEIPHGYVGSVLGRSGLALNKNIHVHHGTIDSDYRGEVRAIVCNLGDETFYIVYGDRIAQIVFHPVLAPDLEEVPELSETVRGAKGFGSSGV